MSKRRVSPGIFLAVQAVVAVVLAISFIGLAPDSRHEFVQAMGVGANHRDLPIPRSESLEISPLYDDPEIVSEEELAAVLEKIIPRFSPEQLKPNHVEHALRTWGTQAVFADPAALDGVELRDVLINHGSFLKSWNRKTPSLLLDQPGGIAIRDDRKPGGSVHHDHWLASLTEAGIHLDEPVFSPGRRHATINTVLQEALRDFRLDERETEWSVMAFGLWLPPAKSWKSADGREISFDQLGRRLLRGNKRFGVCGGTHRVYSLMLLLRLDEEFDILSDPVQEEIFTHLGAVRDLLTASQFADGHWPSNWSSGAQAIKNPIEESTYKKVIATGHHLEWLAIAPQELHPPREQILQAADWVIETTRSQTYESIGNEYTFYSHVGNALALWRGTRPWPFWSEWRKSHPHVAGDQNKTVFHEAQQNTDEPITQPVGD